MDPLNTNKDKIKRESFAYQRSWVESCSPLDDFLKNKIVLGVIIALFIVLSCIFVVCSCLFCRYRKMKYQYYSKVKLLGNRGSNSSIGSGQNRASEERSRDMTGD